MIGRIVIPVFLGLILVILAVAQLQMRALEQALLEEAFLRVYEAVLNETPRHLDAETFAQPFSPAAQGRFRALFGQIKTSPTLRMTLWSPDRVALFSSLKFIVGRRSPNHADLIRLFAEEKAFFIRRVVDENWPRQAGSGEFLDIYVPIRLSEKMVAGVEIHSAVSGILAPVKKQKYYHAAILAASGIAIMIVALLARNLKKDRDRQVVLARRNAELYEQTKRQAAELSRSNAELEQFAYVASHDLQEPLRMINGYIGLLAKRYQDRLDADAQEFIGFVTDGAKRMQRLIQDLLTYSRVGTRGKEFAAADCEAILSETLRTLQPAIQESAATVTHEPLPQVIGDASQLSQLFQNLIGNAIKYRDSKPPEVHVSCRREGNFLIFSVRDNGIGIAPEFADRIFVIFQRLHTAKEYAGTGIGLAVCKKIVERHGGRIWVESEVGRGAVFYFTVPTTGGQSSPEAGREAGAIPEDAPAARLGL